MVWCVEPIVRRRNSGLIARKTHNRYSGRTDGPQTQLTKSCVVAMSMPRIAENPTDAVRDRITVPTGRSLAEELARPISLIFSAVSCTYSTCPSRICQTSASPNHGMVHPFQYSGVCRLGVCPDRSVAANFVLFTSQCAGISPIHSTPESFMARSGSRPFVTAWLISAERFSCSSLINSCCLAMSASTLAVWRSRNWTIAVCSPMGGKGSGAFAYFSPLTLSIVDDIAMVPTKSTKDCDLVK